MAQLSRLLPENLSTSTATDSLGIDRPFRNFIPPLLRLSRPNLRLAAVLASKPIVLIPELGGLGAVLQMLRLIGTNCVVWDPGHFVVSIFFTAITRIPNRCGSRTFPTFLSQLVVVEI